MNFQSSIALFSVLLTSVAHSEDLIQKSDSITKTSNPVELLGQGVDIGNGGRGKLFFNDAGEIERVELLEFYDRNMSHSAILISTNSLTEDEKGRLELYKESLDDSLALIKGSIPIDAVATKLLDISRIDPIFAAILLHVMSRLDWWEGRNLIEPNDSPSLFQGASRKDVVPVAVRKNLSVSVDTNLVQLMNPAHAAGLIIHEALYVIASPIEKTLPSGQTYSLQDVNQVMDMTTYLFSPYLQRRGYTGLAGKIQELSGISTWFQAQKDSKENVTDWTLGEPLSPLTPLENSNHDWPMKDGAGQTSEYPFVFYQEGFSVLPMIRFTITDHTPKKADVDIFFSPDVQEGQEHVVCASFTEQTRKLLASKSFESLDHLVWEIANGFLGIDRSELAFDIQKKSIGKTGRIYLEPTPVRRTQTLVSYEIDTETHRKTPSNIDPQLHSLLYTYVDEALVGNPDSGWYAFKAGNTAQEACAAFIYRILDHYLFDIHQWPVQVEYTAPGTELGKWHGQTWSAAKF